MKPIDNNSLIRGVRQIEIALADPARGGEFYAKVWNLTQVARDGGSIYFRGTSPYHHILVLHQASGQPCVRRVVFDVVDRDTLARLHQALTGAGLPVDRPYAWTQPGGGYGFSFKDPEGRQFAAVCDVGDHADSADQADRPRKIVHINFNAADIARTTTFLTDVLRCSLIDQTPVLSFFHCNSRDHAAIVICGAGKPTINHVAFEMPDLESVMRGAGRMRDAGYPIEWGIGRHSAGNNVFGYFAGPEEFPLELTAEVTQVDESYVPRGSDFWRFPPGRMDQWGITAPHSPRWKRIQDLYLFGP